MMGMWKKVKKKCTDMLPRVIMARIVFSADAARVQNKALENHVPDA